MSCVCAGTFSSFSQRNTRTEIFQPYNTGRKKSTVITASAWAAGNGPRNEGRCRRDSRAFSPLAPACPSPSERSRPARPRASPSPAAAAVLALSAACRRRPRRRPCPPPPRPAARPSELLPLNLQVEPERYWRRLSPEELGRKTACAIVSSITHMDGKKRYCCSFLTSVHCVEAGVLGLQRSARKLPVAG